MNIAIVGATGNVGRKIIEVLEDKKFPISELYLIASSKSAGQKINFKGKEHTVIDLEKFEFSKVKIAFFAAGSAVAEKWAHKAAEKTVVIDNSKFFRKDPDIPLIVPEVNSKELLYQLINLFPEQAKLQWTNFCLRLKIIIIIKICNLNILLNK